MNPPLWKATVPATKAEANDIAAAFELGSAPQVLLIQEEPFEDRAVVEALYVAMPDGELLSKLAGRAVHVALLPDVDWIKLSQHGLPPVRAGRFFVYGAHDAGEVPHGVVPIRIDGPVRNLRLRRPTGVPVGVRIGGGANHIHIDGEELGAIGRGYHNTAPTNPDHYTLVIAKAVDRLTITH